MNEIDGTNWSLFHFSTPFQEGVMAICVLAVSAEQIPKFFAIDKNFMRVLIHLETLVTFQDR